MKEKQHEQHVGDILCCFRQTIRIMRLSLVFMVVSTAMAFSAATYSQSTKLSVNLKDATVREVFDAIERQSEYLFLYQEGQVDLNRHVSIEVKGRQLKEILDEMFRGTDNIYIISDRQVVIGKAPRKALEAQLSVLRKDLETVIQQPQQNEITGKVTDTSGEPLPGATVMVKGTTIGTITNADGNFSLRIPANAQTLQVSFVGMKTVELPIGNQTTFNVVLEEEAIGLQEVVAVGYGVQRKVNLVGAVSVAKMDEKVTSRPLTNVSTALQGLVPGLLITQNSAMAGKNDVNMTIRGLGTVNNANPLVIVDGMPDVDINRININDIESISVLKDAASAAVYGSRAANGVILITTKSGKGESKTKITASATFAVENPTKAYEFMADYPRALTVHQREAAVNTSPENFLFKNGTIDQWMALGMIDPVRYPNTEWWDIILRTGVVQNYNISAMGGSEKSNFFISAGILDEKGLQINNDYTRYNARFNYDAKIRSNINVGARFAGNWSKYLYALDDGFIDDDPAGGNFDLQHAIAGILPYDPTTGYFGGVMAYNEDPQAYNPYVQYKNMLNHQNRQEANVSGYIEWIPLEGLSGHAEYALNYYNQFRYNANIPARAYNFQTGLFGSRVYVGDNAGVSNYTNTGYKTQLTVRLNYDKLIADYHQINIMLAYNEEYWYDRFQMSSRNDRLHPSLHEIDAALTDIQGTGGNSSTEGLRSYIGRINYSAFEKYLLELNFRSDGSSKFLSGNQFGFFPSIAGGWRFSEENFIKKITDPWLTYGKLRVSYGTLGNNSGVGRYEQQETLAASNYMIDGKIVKGFVNKKMINRELSWEETSVFNVGLDLGFFKNRLTTELDYYDRLTTGMNRPSEMSILLTGAYNAPRRNIGNLRNRGIEGNFTWRDKNGDFDYFINANISYNATVLEKWNEFLGRGWVFLDMPYHFLYTYEDMGIAQTWQDVYNATPQGASPGDILRKDLNGDGRIDGNDRKAYPHIQRDRPTANFSLNAGMSWKGLDLSVLLYGTTGRKDYWINNYNKTNIGTQRYASTWDHWNKPWSVENRNGGWPRLGGSGNREETTFWLDNLSYLRVKNIQIGYTLPAGFFQKLGVSSIRIYGSAENLMTLTGYRGLDPEKTGNKSDAYPLNKLYSFGINIGI
jgi:TonB-linked SusC/RagA family outer membrane protein